MNVEEVTYTVNRCANKVYTTLGNGFKKSVYQESLAIELEEAGLKFRKNVEQSLFYKGLEVGNKLVDFVIEDAVVVEIETLMNLENLHLMQAKKSITAYNVKLGLLINFGADDLQLKTIYNAVPKFAISSLI